MIIKLYRTIALALTLFILAIVAHADTVASFPEVFPTQTLKAPAIEVHPYSEGINVFLFAYNEKACASTELYRSTNPDNG